MDILNINSSNEVPSSYSKNLWLILIYTREIYIYIYFIICFIAQSSNGFVASNIPLLHKSLDFTQEKSALLYRLPSPKNRHRALLPVQKSNRPLPVLGPAVTTIKKLAEEARADNMDLILVMNGFDGLTTNIWCRLYDCYSHLQIWLFMMIVQYTYYWSPHRVSIWVSIFHGDPRRFSTSKASDVHGLATNTEEYFTDRTASLIYESV